MAESYRYHIDYKREAALRAWVAFIAMFVFLRGLTYGIRHHLLPAKNVVTSSGLHIHHFVWGILILLVIGFLALMLEQPRWHPWLAIGFGFGAALVIDEFALWLNLKDVYWAKEGRSSVDLAIVIFALLGLYYAADRFWRDIIRDLGRAARFLVTGEHRILGQTPTT
ncbi:MAG TPA: hypothetical protein VEQ12_07335 [Candidatus Limnocylindria bacterium]|nr:hypothetical protein [Candidatus Limnocylindria bacterium]